MKVEEEETDLSAFPILQLINALPPINISMSIKDSVPVLPRINSYPDIRERRRSSVPVKAKSMINLRDFSEKSSTRGRRSSRETESSEDRSGCLYTPVNFEINTPDKLPYMGKEYRQVGKVKRVSTETSAMKQNMVQNKNLDRVKDSLGKRREQMQKEYTRKLTLWHMELERNKNHSDPALKRRTMRILKFIDKMAQPREDFHFKDSFFLDLMDPEYLPEPSPPPIRKDLKRPITKPPTRDSSHPAGHFKRRDPKTESLAAKFSECRQAGEVPSKGYVYVKVYSDPYYRYLPPLSAASKNYEVRMCRLPYKELRNEAQWGKFVDSLNKPKTPPPPPSPQMPTELEMKRQRTEELRQKLPVISLLPKWMQVVNDVTKANRYKPAMETIRSRPNTRSNRIVTETTPVTECIAPQSSETNIKNEKHRISAR